MLLNTDINIGEIIRKHRADLNISQRELASMCGISHPTIGAYEEGRGTPSLFNLIKLAKGLGFTSFDDFLGKSIQQEDVKAKQIVQAYKDVPADKRAIVDFILNIK